MSDNRHRIVYGVGKNDADYSVVRKIGGKRVWCPFYKTWLHMMERAYSTNFKAKRLTYKDVSVCEEWLTFSNFKAWMEQQDWEGKELDKDILVVGNKVYSPDACCFVTRVVNMFVVESKASRGIWPIGVYFHKLSQKFMARCNNPFTKKRIIWVVLIVPMRLTKLG